MRTANGLHIPRDPYSYGRGSMRGSEFFPFALMGGGATATEGHYDTRDITLASGETLREVVSEIEQMLAYVSEVRDTVLGRLVFETTEHAIKIFQAPTEIQYEEGSEYGTPGMQRVTPASYTVGLPIKSYKVATGWTIEALADMTADELRRGVDAYVLADNNLQWQLALQTLFNDLAGTTATFADKRHGALTVHAPLLNGDGIVAPPLNGVTFAGSHDHYLIAGGTTLTQANVQTMSDDLDSHGHRSNKVLFVHPDDAPDVVAMADFVAGPDPLVADPAAVFARVGADFMGVIAGMGVRVRKWSTLPTGYAFMFNDYGVGSRLNPVARREHPAGHALRGLQLYRPDPQTIYPLEQTFYQRWIGFGSNERTNGVVMQLTAGAYAVPVILSLREG